MEDDFVTSYAPYVVRLAHSIRPRDPDAVSEALLALIYAARTFDPHRGVPFNCYVRNAVIRRVRRATRRANLPLSVPTWLIDASDVIRESLTAADGSPDVDQARMRLRDRFSGSTGYAQRMLRLAMETDALASFARVDSMTPLPAETAADDGDGPDAIAERRMLQQAVRRAVHALPPLEREVTTLRHFSGLSQRAIAERLGVSRRAVRTALQSAHERLRRDLADWRPED